MIGFLGPQTREKYDQLQQNIDPMFEWSQVWELTFHPVKCHVLHLGSQNIKQQYTMGGAHNKILLSDSELEEGFYGDDGLHAW